MKMCIHMEELNTLFLTQTSTWISGFGTKHNSDNSHLLLDKTHHNISLQFITQQKWAILMSISIMSTWNIHLTIQTLPFPLESFISYQGTTEGILYDMANSQKDHSPNSSTPWFPATVTMSSSSFSSMRCSRNRYSSTTGIFCPGNDF